MIRYINEENRNWKAKWVWCANAKDRNTFVYFRKEFMVSDSSRLTVFITADTRYRLYINDTYVRTGPVLSQPYNVYYDEQDITQWIKKGNNSLAIEVYYAGHVEDTQGGLLLEIINEKEEVIVQSDESFKTKYADSWEQKTYFQHINWYAPYQEIYDRRLEPVDWKKVGFDDGDWENAKIITGRDGLADVPVIGPWCKIQKRTIPDMKERVVFPIIIQKEECLYLMNRFRPYDLSISLSQAGSPLKYASINSDQNNLDNQLELFSNMDEQYGGVYNPVLLLDFNQEITAYFEIELEGKAGQSVEIGYAERLVDGYFNNCLECQFADKYILKDGSQTFRAYHWRGFRYVRLIFKDCEAGIKVKSIKGNVTEYPFEDRGMFATEDRALQKVFDICKNTIRLCCNEAIVDTPWREQGQWTGDVSAVTLGGIYSLFGESRLPDKFLKQSSENQLIVGLISNVTNVTPWGYLECMIDYNYWWIIAIWNHYLYVGDKMIIHKMYPTIVKIIMTSDIYRDEYGMLNKVPYVMFLDWTVHDRKGESSILNALYYGTIKAVKEMAELKNDDYMIQYCCKTMELIEKNFNHRFWDEEKEVYVDANYEDMQSDIISETGNMLPIYFGLCDGDRGKNLIKTLFVNKNQEYIEANPFMALYTLKAASIIDEEEFIISFLKEKWYRRFVEKGLSGTAEEWSINGSYRYGKFYPIYRSLSHAWSAGPAEFLLKDWNRIQIIEPGGGKVKVLPRKMPCDYEVIYPLQKGNIRIKQSDGNIQVSATGEVEILNYDSY